MIVDNSIWKKDDCEYRATRVGRQVQLTSIKFPNISGKWDEATFKENFELVSNPYPEVGSVWTRVEGINAGKEYVILDYHGDENKDKIHYEVYDARGIGTGKSNFRTRKNFLESFEPTSVIKVSKKKPEPASAEPSPAKPKILRRVLRRVFGV